MTFGLQVPSGRPSMRWASAPIKTSSYRRIKMDASRSIGQRKASSQPLTCKSDFGNRKPKNRSSVRGKQTKTKATGSTSSRCHNQRYPKRRVMNDRWMLLSSLTLLTADGSGRPPSDKQRRQPCRTSSQTTDSVSVPLTLAGTERPIGRNQKRPRQHYSDYGRKFGWVRANRIMLLA